jgi:hypothetical protein
LKLIRDTKHLLVVIDKCIRPNIHLRLESPHARDLHKGLRSSYFTFDSIELLSNIIPFQDIKYFERPCKEIAVGRVAYCYSTPSTLIVIHRSFLSMVRIMVAVDSDKSSEKAFQEALKSFHPDTDKLYLCSMYVTTVFKNTTSIFIQYRFFFNY